MQRKIKTPAWVAGKTIYEVNLRQFTKEGTIKAFEEHLPKLKELGVGILWFMPIQPIGKKNRKGTLGSYYSISNYKEVNPEFGTIDDFKSLVKKIHDMDMKVIIDWVANHTAWDHHWTVDHPEFYEKDEKGNFKAPVEDWEDVIHLDYGNPDLWDTMIDAMKFWLIETDIDGFRCDMAHLVPTLFWNRARRDLDRVMLGDDGGILGSRDAMHRVSTTQTAQTTQTTISSDPSILPESINENSRSIYMLAESDNYDLLEYAFDTIYNWKLMHAMNEVAAGNANSKKLGETISNEFNYLPKGASFMNFTSNHDENSWQGSAIERIHYFLEPMTVLTFLIPGMPLIYSGQEAGNYRRLKFFDKDEIEWKDDKMFGLYKKLSELKGKLPNFSEEVKMRIVKSDAPEKILAIALFEREVKCLLLLNLSDKAVDFYVKCQQLEGPFRNAIQQEDKTGYSCHNQFKLAAYGYLVLVK